MPELAFTMDLFSLKFLRNEGLKLALEGLSA